MEVERGPGDFLDLEIRPWLAPTEYGTPDIWIDWPGNGAEDYPNSDPPVGNGDPTHWSPDQSVVNWIKVRVHNNGTVVGKGVVVRAFINDPMGMGDKGTFQPLPNSAPQDIPAGGFKVSLSNGVRKQNGHTCIRAEIFTHESDFGDLDLNNNDAQENVTSFSPSAGSHHQPVKFAFKVNNDFNYPIEVELIPAGLADGMDLGALKTPTSPSAQMRSAFCVAGSLSISTRSRPRRMHAANAIIISTCTPFIARRTRFCPLAEFPWM